MAEPHAEVSVPVFRPSSAEGVLQDFDTYLKNLGGAIDVCQAACLDATQHLLDLLAQADAARHSHPSTAGGHGLHPDVLAAGLATAREQVCVLSAKYLLSLQQCQQQCLVQLETQTAQRMGQERTELSQEAAALGSQQQALGQHRAQVEAALAQLRDQMRTSCKPMMTERKRLQDHVVACQHEVDRLRLELAAKEQELHRAQQALAAAEAQTHNALAQFKPNQDALQADLDAIHHHEAQLAEVATLINQRHAALEQELAQHRHTMRALREQNAALCTHVRQLQAMSSQAAVYALRRAAEFLTKVEQHGAAQDDAPQSQPLSVLGAQDAACMQQLLHARRHMLASEGQDSASSSQLSTPQSSVALAGGGGSGALGQSTPSPDSRPASGPGHSQRGLSGSGAREERLGRTLMQHGQQEAMADLETRLAGLMSGVQSGGSSGGKGEGRAAGEGDGWVWRHVLGEAAAHAPHTPAATEGPHGAIGAATSPTPTSPDTTTNTQLPPQPSITITTGTDEDGKDDKIKAPGSAENGTVQLLNSGSAQDAAHGTKKALANMGPQDLAQNLALRPIATTAAGAKLRQGSEISASEAASPQVPIDTRSQTSRAAKAFLGKPLNGALKSLELSLPSSPAIVVEQGPGASPFNMSAADKARLAAAARGAGQGAGEGTLDELVDHMSAQWLENEAFDLQRDNSHVA